MLGLDGVVDVAHRAEDLLGALRDGRLTRPQGPGRPAARRRPRASAARCRVPTRPVGADELAAVVAALDRRRRRRRPGDRAAAAPTEDEPVDDGRRRRGRPRGGDSVRVPTRRVHDLLDVVGEAELDVRRVEPARPGARDAGRRARAGPRAPCASRWPARDVDPPACSTRCTRWSALGDQLRRRRPRAARPAPRTRQARLADVRDGAMGLAMVPVRRVVAGFPQLVRELSRRDADDPARTSRSCSPARTSSSTRGCSTASPTRCATWSPTPSTTAASRRPSGSRPASRRRRRSPSSARAAGSTVVIEVSDDGARHRRGRRCARRRSRAGCCRPTPPSPAPRCCSVLFSPGFSTRDEVTETSGRGVGLDVVRTVGRGPRRHRRGARRARRGTTLHHHACRSRSACCAACVARVGDERYARARARRRRDARPGRRPSGTRSPACRCSSAHGGTMPLVDLGPALGVPGDRDAAGRRRRPARRRRRAAGLGGRRARGRARARRQGARRLPRPAAHASPARPSTATAAWCCCSTCASSPSASWPSGGGQAPASLRRRRTGVRRQTPPGRSPGRGCWSSRTRSACASCSG